MGYKTQTILSCATTPIFLYLYLKHSGGPSALKKPSHFGVRKSSNQVTRMHYFPQKVDDLF